MNRHLLLTCAAWVCVACPTATLANDAEIEALKAQLEMLSKRLNALEKERATDKATLDKVSKEMLAEPGKRGKPRTPHNEEALVTAGKMPGSIKIPGTNTSLKFGGYVKLDGIYDTDGAYGSQFANFANIPLDGSANDRRDAEFNAHARSSRFNMQTLTPTDYGDIKTFIEVDFFGSARGNPATTNGEGIQLRHAYGEVGRVLAGQTWSNFMDVAAYPESLDYVGPTGLTFVRQAQLRFTESLNDNWQYAVALEAPNTSFTPATNNDQDLSDLPDATARVTYKGNFGHLSFRGLARKLDASNVNTGVEDETFGWGTAISGRINTVGKNNIAFQGVYGDGVGHYLLEVAVGQNGSSFVGNNIDSQVAYGGYLSYQHHWSETWRSNILAGYTGIDNDVRRTGTAVNKYVASGHLNLIWQPVKEYWVGFEYMRGERELESGLEGDLNRFQTSLKYIF